MSSEYSYKYIRDPLYGFIGISEREEEIIQTPIFQRLRRIKQLSNTYLVYPSANHSRFEHSLGTLYLAGLVSDKLRLKREDTKILRLAALIHDVGHGPFSHVFEIAMKWINGDDYSHEDATAFIIKHDEDLSKAIGKYKSSVLSVFEDKKGLFHRIISSVFDIDKMDYFRRDSYHAGVDYGTYDFNRIILSLCKISRFGEEYFGIQERGMRAVESFRLARFNLWDQVYQHHTRIVADNMVLRAIKYAFEERVLEDDKLKLDESNNKDFCSYYSYLDDYSIQHLILNRSNGISSEIIQNIRDRKLLKRAFRVNVDRSGVRDPTIRRNIITMNIEETEKEIAEKTGISPEEILIYIQNYPIRGYPTGNETSEEEEILVLMRNGEVRDIDSISPLTIKFKSIRRLYVFCKDDINCRKKICNICEEKYETKSDLDIP